MIDTHCHLDAAAFDADRGAVLARAWAAGVTDVLVPAVQPAGWGPLVELVRATPGLHAGLGIHPQFLPGLDPRDDDRHLADLGAALARGGAVMVGECGLDGPTAAGGAPLDRQLAVLAGHLALARAHHLPVSLHAFRTLGPLLALLERDGLPDGGVLHSFSGSAEQVAPYVRLGLHFAFAGPLTWERARKPLLAARAVPGDRLLLETDAPDQTPRPHHGRCEPAHLAEVCAGLAAATGRTPAEVDALTSASARRLFRLPVREAGP
ncbi:MAG: TatD family hydrolase [Anaeromyxobacter sp.]|nr:TatD family hydrolase [Anaeromyxobacter sp.]MBL0277764.1 TatD family hydrolase [Anaeromyxobacter sp.]